jgi:hypothetical protein
MVGRDCICIQIYFGPLVAFRTSSEGHPGCRPGGRVDRSTSGDKQTRPRTRRCKGHAPCASRALALPCRLPPSLPCLVSGCSIPAAAGTRKSPNRSSYLWRRAGTELRLSFESDAPWVRSVQRRASNPIVAYTPRFAMAGNGYQKMEDELEYSTAGWTSAQAEAQQKKWGKNEIPEEKEPVSAHILCLEPPRCLPCCALPKPACGAIAWVSLTRPFSEGLCSSMPLRSAALEDVCHAVCWHHARHD